MLPTLALLLALSVTDGDTIVLDGQKIRIANVDAPEVRTAKCDAEKRLGLVAARRLEDLLRSGKVVVHFGDPKDGRKRDRHGRTLATITVDGHDVGAIMIEEGLARPWTGKRQPWCQ